MKNKNIDEIQEEIEFLTNNSEHQFEIRETIENLFNKLVAQVEDSITTFKNNKNINNKPVITTDTTNIKLPPINLSTCDGNYMHWR